MDIDEEYTASDHSQREEDAYALSKYRITLEWLSRFHAPIDARILNIGAGSGVFTRIASTEGFSVTDLEPDPQAASLAQQTTGGSNLLNMGVMDLDPIRFQFDVVVMHDVLEHLEDDSAAVHRVWQVLGQGKLPALFIASVPAWPFLFGLHDEKLGHYRRYTPQSFKALIGERFERRTFRQLGLLGIPAALTYSRWLRKPYPVGSGGIGERIFAWSCAIEERLAPPIGSSLLIAATPRYDDQIPKFGGLAQT